MGKLIVTEFMTLDGVAQAPGGLDEDRDGGFTHGGWQAPVADQESGVVIFQEAKTMNALVLGRKTYEIFANYWPSAPAESPFTSLLNGVPKYVASRTLTGPLSWQGSTVIAGDFVDEITALKANHDEVHVIGSLGLLQSLLHLDLVDQIRLWLYPLVLGSGKRVFGDGAIPAALRLTQSVTYPSGTLHLVYEAAGVPVYADMGAGE